jgi:hypothetical protein
MGRPKRWPGVLFVGVTVVAGACGSGDNVSTADQPHAANDRPRCEGAIESSHFDYGVDPLAASSGPQTPEEALDLYARANYVDLTAGSFAKTSASSSEVGFSFDDPEAGEIIVRVTNDGSSWHVTTAETCVAAHTKRAKR